MRVNGLFVSHPPRLAHSARAKRKRALREPTLAWWHVELLGRLVNVNVIVHGIVVVHRVVDEGARPSPTSRRGFRA
eukprot:4160508-Prymnesium_polylepis.1